MTRKLTQNDSGNCWHSGGCHCGAVKFVAYAPARIRALRCNCSICSMNGFLHLIVPARDFRLLSGANRLNRYRFNSLVAEHLFCSRCGIKSYYIPRSNPDGYSINVNCLDPATIESVEIEEFDGKNWETHGAGLAHLSVPD